MPQSTLRTRLDPPPHITQRGSGAPVVLLHGWGASSALFAPHLEALSHNYQVIAVDFPGFGHTPPPPAAWAVDDYAQWTLAVLDQLALGQVHLVGHSFGGRIAIALASSYPQRVGKLVLTGSAGIRPTRSLGYHLRVRLFKLMRGLVRSKLVPQGVRKHAEAYVQAQGSSDYQAASGTVRSSFVRVVNEDLRERLPRIKAPTLLIWGENDADTPLSDGKLMEQLLPDAGLVVFAGAGHYAYLEQAGRFCTIVETFFRS
jgi:pimeloyl-ACP methyl ester carboxylesterase